MTYLTANIAFERINKLLSNFKTPKIYKYFDE